MDREKHCKNGGFYIRKEEFNGRGGKTLFDHCHVIKISRKHRCWETLSKHDTEEECDWEIEQLLANYDNCIYEK
jgi:hypothetical protein